MTWYKVRRRDGEGSRGWYGRYHVSSRIQSPVFDVMNNICSAKLSQVLKLKLTRKWEKKPLRYLPRGVIAIKVWFTAAWPSTRAAKKTIKFFYNDVKYLYGRVILTYAVQDLQEPYKNRLEEPRIRKTICQATTALCIKKRLTFFRRNVCDTSWAVLATIHSF
jgi:hypothetical protein